MPRRSRARRKSGGKLLFLGLVLVGALVFVVWSGQKPKDWSRVAADKLAEAAYGEAIEAADRGLAQDDGNFDLWFIRATASNAFGLSKSALHDIRKALALSPQNQTYIVFEANVLAARREYDEALAAIDAAHERMPRSSAFRLIAATIRLGSITYLTDQLAQTLTSSHPEPFRVVQLIEDVLDSPEFDSPARRELVDALPPGPTRDEIETKVKQCWTRLREADELLGDVRTSRDIVPRASLARAEIDYRLGRLLQAKEELQILLTTTLQPGLRREAHQLLARVMTRLGIPSAALAAYQDVLDMEGGIDAAPLVRAQDMFEALFFSAEIDPGRRAKFIAEADAHLKTRRGVDMRTCGYRGIAALEWENKPEQAIDWLNEAYDALRMKRDKDPSILRPDRVERFVLALLDAHVKARQLDRGLAIANALTELSPRDPELRKRRATLLQELGRSNDAANDLLMALRNSRRDPQLFAQWLALAQTRKDAGGSTPLDRAKAATEGLRAKRQAVFDRLRAIGADGKNTNSARTTPRIAAALTEAAGIELRAANDPAVAWLMAEEFARVGEIGEAQNLMFRATHDEPDVREFAFRQALYSLDEGHYAAAAESFEDIFSKDSGDTEAARFAVLAYDLAGDVAASRRVRAEALRHSTTRSILVLPVLAALEAGEPKRAFEQLFPFLGAAAPDVQLLVGRTYLDLAQYDRAIGALENARKAMSDPAEALHYLVLAHALSGDSTAATAAATELAAQVHVIPLVDVEASLTRLEAAGKRRDAAVFARAIAPRFSAEHQLALEARACRNQFLTGDPKPLRELRDQTDLASRLDDATVMACFGLTLRENGPKAAAEYLQRAREYTSKRAQAALPTALAYALTLLRSETTTFVKRYQRDLGGKQVPLDDVVAWWICAQMSPQDVDDLEAQRAAMEPGAEAELLWLKTSYETEGASGKSAWEACALFLLFEAAGPGFEGDAAAIAQDLVSRDGRALSATRFLADRAAAESGPAAAVTMLTKAQSENPSDVRTYLALSQYLATTDTTGVVLYDLAQAGRTLFPNRLEPYVHLARAAMARQNWTEARVALEQAADRWPLDDEILKLRAMIATATKDDELAARVTQAFADRPLDDPMLRAFVLRRLTDRPDLAAEARDLLSRIVLAAPDFYEAAALLAKLQVDGGAIEDVRKLAQNTATVVAGDRDALRAGPVLAGMAELLHAQKLTQEALLVTEAGLLADPASIPLRRQHIVLLLALNRRAQTLDDMRLLVSLAPRNKETLLDYTNMLLSERADQAHLAATMLKSLVEVAGNDPRLSLVKARLFFRSDQLEPALTEYVRALSDTKLTGATAFQFGAWNYIAGKADVARKVFATLPSDHPLRPRSEALLALMQSN